MKIKKKSLIIKKNKKFNRLKNNIIKFRKKTFKNKFKYYRINI